MHLTSTAALDSVKVYEFLKEPVKVHQQGFDRLGVEDSKFRKDWKT